MQIFFCIIDIMENMEQTTRLRILDHIRHRNTASAAELSRLLGMTGANIRHHLAVLEENDLIEVVSKRQDGRGRPMMIYGLSRQSLGDALDKLSSALLEEWFTDPHKGERDANLRALANRMGAAFICEAPATLIKRLTDTYRYLNQFHYQARWEAGASGSLVFLGHCPYSAILGKHPELCQMDAYLLEKLTGRAVIQTARLELALDGLPQCIFLVQ
jgi:predicted ArsR family transcriptional regulator